MEKKKDKKKEQTSFQRFYERDANASPMSAEDIRNKFGLTYNEAHVGGSSTHPNGSNNDTGAIYNRETGEYIGSVTNHKNVGQNFEGMRSFAKESGLLMEDVNGIDSLNDVATIASQLNMGGKAQSAESPEEDPSEALPSPAEAVEGASNINTDNSVSNSNDVNGDFTADDFLGMYINNSFNATGGTLNNSGDLTAGGDISLDNSVTNSNTVNSFGSDANNAQEFMNKYKLQLSK